MAIVAGTFGQFARLRAVPIGFLQGGQVGMLSSIGNELDERTHDDYAGAD